jgi:ABC-2 type transport system permease protein
MFVYVLVVSAALGSALGIAMTRLVPNAKAAAPIVQAPFLVLQFISGVFFMWQNIPFWLQAIATIFPLRWMAQGFRYAFLPDWFGEAEYGASWGWQLPVAVLAGWLVLSFVLALVFFRWDRGADR